MYERIRSGMDTGKRSRCKERKDVAPRGARDSTKEREEENTYNATIIVGEA